MKRQGYIAGLIVLCLLTMMVLAVRAAQAQQEEPAPGVARVSLIHGDVSTMRGDSGDWVATTINAPVVRGDKVATGEKSQAEIQLDYGNVLRLGPQTEVRIADLTRTVIQVQVAQGLVNHTVFKDSEAEVEIDTPNMAVRPLRDGVYRIQVDSTTETQLIVRKGEAEVATPDGSTRVEDGRIIIVRGSDHPEYQIAKAPHRDDWDQWNKERDSEINNAQSYRYANRYYTGAQDLDRNGRWIYVPDYDWVWSPYVGAGWAPYRYGYWGWQPYWGWTWISYEPWGWAPYHYGRWFYWNSSWCWWPGYHYYGYRPYWGPAWVSFVGFGFGGRNWHFGFGYGYNSIGWLALGPYDRHYPWWGRHNSYNVVNITNITNITNVNGRGETLFHRNGGRAYASNLQSALTNSNVRAGMSHVSTDDFVRGNIPRQQRPLDAATLRGGQLVEGRIPAAPTRDSLRPIGRQVNTASLPGRSAGTEKFFSRRQAPTVSRSFNEQASDVQRMMQRNPAQAAGRGASSGAASSVARSAPSGTVANSSGNAGRAIGRAVPSGNAGATPGRGSGATGEVARATTPASTRASGNVPVAVQGGEQTGWRSFGQARSNGVGRSSTATPPATGRQFAQRAAPASSAQGSQSQPAQKPQAAPQQNSNWRRFGTGQPRAVPNRPTTVGTPQGDQTERQAAPGRTGTLTPAARPAPQGRSEGASRSFGTQGQPAPAQRSTGASQSNAAPAAGWSRFGGRSENPQGARSGGDNTPPARTQSRSEGSQAQGWSRFPSRAAPTQGTERPALGIRKPITTERSAPSSRSRNFGSSGRAAPSTPPRSYGSGNRGWSVPSGNVRSAPSAPSRTYGGGNRGMSAPSRGSSVRSAPSRSSGGGGGRSTSAPSRGGGSSSAARGGRGRR